jgi:hypothetical protein
MATPDELRTEIATARDALRAALQSASPTTWEQQPIGSADGEDSWSPRQAAEHVIGAEIYFTNLVCKACGYPGPDSPFEGGEPSFDTVDAARAAFDDAVVAADSKIKYITATDLAIARDEGTVESLVAFWPEHTREHALQIDAAGKSP